MKEDGYMNDRLVAIVILLLFFWYIYTYIFLKDVVSIEMECVLVIPHGREVASSF